MVNHGNCYQILYLASRPAGSLPFICFLIALIPRSFPLKIRRGPHKHFTASAHTHSAPSFALPEIEGPPCLLYFLGHRLHFAGCLTRIHRGAIPKGSHTSQLIMTSVLAQPQATTLKQTPTCIDSLGYERCSLNCPSNSHEIVDRLQRLRSQLAVQRHRWDRENLNSHISLCPRRPLADSGCHCQKNAFPRRSPLIAPAGKKPDCR